MKRSPKIPRSRKWAARYLIVVSLFNERADAQTNDLISICCRKPMEWTVELNMPLFCFPLARFDRDEARV